MYLEDMGEASREITSMQTRDDQGLWMCIEYIEKNEMKKAENTTMAKRGLLLLAFLI